jgi:aspartyl protease
MRINGKWLLCDDGVVRPMVRGEVLAGDGSWERVEFLVDTGADRTVFSAATLAKLSLQTATAHEGISVLGGAADSVVVETQIRLIRENSGKVVFRGHYAAVTELDSLDIDVLDRDITGFFTVIVDQPGDIICLLGQRHRYTIQHER